MRGIDLNERWLPVPGWDDYEVSDAGRIRRSRAGGNWPALRLLSPAASDTGHLYVMLSKDNRSKKQFVHRLMLMAFVGLPPFDGAMALHEDDNPRHNNLGNLYWGTKLNNHNDRMRNRGWDRRATAVRGSQASWAKLTEQAVREIRKLKESGARTGELAMQFGVSAPTICDVIAGRRWGHVQ